MNVTFARRRSGFGRLEARAACLAIPLVILSSCGGEPAAEDSGVARGTDAPGQEAPNTLTEAERADGWRLLFDGETSSGWRGYNRDVFPDTGWAVRDGMLVVGATATDPDVPIGGDLVSEESFGSFDLRFQFRLSAVANSGVLYRVIEQPGAEIWHNAPEFQVLDDPAYLDMGTMDMRTHLTGDNYDLHEASARPLRPLGEWNQGRIVVDGSHVEHWLNGTMTVEYELGSPEWEALVAASKFAPYPDYGQAVSGPIGLQDHGRQVWYRSIKIKPLSSDGAEPPRGGSVSRGALPDAVSLPAAGPLPDAVSIFNGEDLDGWQVHGTERWFVEDGDLVCESGPDMQYGYLSTDQKFTDLDLMLEFKQEADGNSGVFFRSSVEGTTVSGWQAEVAPPGLFTGGIYESYGRGWLIQPDSTLHDVAMGKWNRMRVRAVGDTVTTWLNGTRMIHLVDEKIGAGRGSIALQIHDGGGIRVRWRNLRIRDLSAGSGR